MAETIALPHSGVVLTRAPQCERVYLLPHKLGWLYDGDADSSASFDRESMFGTRDECIAWLDARVLALRAALAPADARERVAKALAVVEGCGDRCVDVPCDACWRAFTETADAVLDAIAGGA